LNRSTGDTLFLAGPPDLIDKPKTRQEFEAPATQVRLAGQAAANEGAEGAVLWAVSISDGWKITENPLDWLPVFDGMIAANRLDCTTVDGNVIALRGESSSRNRWVSSDSGYGLREPTLTHSPFEGTLVEERHFSHS
jgi:hypothetical protein